MITTDIPKTLYCQMGGSGTWGCDFPEDVDYPGITLLRKDMEFETPFGTTVPMKLYRIDGSLTADGKDRDVIYVPFHGWMGMTPLHNWWSERVFWILREAGVRYILGEGSGGSINPLLEPGDILVVSDFIDYTKRPSRLGDFCPYSIRMNEIINPCLSDLLYKAAQKHFKRVFRNGTYGVSEGPRFESAAEVKQLYDDHCDIAAQTLMPEAALARAIGAEYASMYIISNDAEGIKPKWEQSIFDIYEGCAPIMGKAMIDAVASIDPAKVRLTAEENIIKMPEHVKNRIKA